MLLSIPGGEKSVSRVTLLFFSRCALNEERALGLQSSRGSLEESRRGVLGQV